MTHDEMLKHIRGLYLETCAVNDRMKSAVQATFPLGTRVRYKLDGRWREGEVIRYAMPLHSLEVLHTRGEMPDLVHVNEHTLKVVGREEVDMTGRCEVTRLAIEVLADNDRRAIQELLTLCDMLRSTYNESGESGERKLPDLLDTSDVDANATCRVSHEIVETDPLCEACGC